MFPANEWGDTVSSHGQRFRRRALRRGYKVDEVDAFLDRVEATLAGEQVGGPVSAQDVHDVVFRVRFGGYDEWQVDLHLDRVERQLAEQEDRTGPDRGGPERGGPDRGMDRGGMDRGGRGPEPRMTPDRAGSIGRGAPPTERLQAPVRDERTMPQRPAPAGPGRSQYEEPAYNQAAGYDTGSYDAFEPGRHGKMDMTAEIRLPERESRSGGAPGYDPGPERGASERGGPDYGGPLDRGGYGGPPQPERGAPSFGGGPDRAPERGVPSFGGGFGGGPAPMSAPPTPNGFPVPSSPMSGPPMGGAGGDLHRVDQLRRTFQPRRFGSGYDPSQVDGLFDGILNAMSGRGPLPVNEAELDTLQFGLVPGGYFEAEVDAALREVKEILRRR